MTVTLGTTPYSNWQPLAPLLQVIGCHTTHSNAWHLNNQQPPEGFLLLGYTTPGPALLTAMANGVAPEEALSEWAQAAQSLVNLFKANRRRTVLINLQHAAENLPKLAQTLAGQWQLNIEPPPAVNTEPATPAKPEHQLLASVTIQQSTELDKLLAQLEACTVPLAETDKSANQVAPNALYQQLESDAAARAQEQTQAQEESQLLLEQLHQVQEALEQQTLAARQAEKQHAEQKAANAKMEAELRQANTAHTKTKAELATLENQLEALKDTAKEQAEENQLLIEQLHLVQEELERQFLKGKEFQSNVAKLQNENLAHKQAVEEKGRAIKALNSQLSDLKNQLAAANKHRADWEQKFQKAEQEHALAVADANRRLADLRTELKSVVGSRSWRLTSPIRSYSKQSKKVKIAMLEEQKAQVANSGLFDEAWYLETYPDVAKSQVNPIEHYLKAGAYEGRNPSETFDTTWYLIYYRDVTESGLNPLIHYIRYGQKENRAPRPGATASLPAPQA